VKCVCERLSSVLDAKCQLQNDRKREKLTETRHTCFALQVNMNIFTNKCMRHGYFAERIIMQLFVRGLETIEALEVSQDATIAGVKVSPPND